MVCHCFHSHGWMRACTNPSLAQTDQLSRSAADDMGASIPPALREATWPARELCSRWQALPTLRSPSQALPLALPSFGAVEAILRSDRRGFAAPAPQTRLGLLSTRATTLGGSRRRGLVPSEAGSASARDRRRVRNVRRLATSAAAAGAFSTSRKRGRGRLHCSCVASAR